MTSIIYTLSTQQVAALSTSAISKLTASDVNAMTTADVAALSAKQLNALSTPALQALSSTQLGAISYSTFLALTNAQLANLSPTQVSQLSQTDVSLLTDSQLNGLSQAALQQLNVSYLTNAQIAGLSKFAISRFTAAQLQTILQAWPQAVTTQQVGALTNQQLSGLNAANLNALNQQVVGLTASQLNNLSANAVGNLSNSQISKLSAGQVSAFSIGQLNALGSNQIANLSAQATAALSATQLAGLSQANLNAVKVNYLSAQTISQLGNSTLQNLSATQTSSLLANQGYLLSVGQISAFSASQLASTKLVGAANGLQFNLTWAASAQNAPTGYQNAAIAAAAGLAANFSSKVVINTQIGYGEVNGSPVAGGAAGENESFYTTVSYSALTSALKANAGNSPIQSVADASLPATNPTGGSSLVISTAQAKALGLAPASSAIDGYVSLSSAINFEYNQTAQGGDYDAVGIFQHEMTEMMGRTGSVGAAFGSGVYTSLDLFRYTSTNNANLALGTPTRELTQLGGNTSYFSIDKGATNLGNYNPSNGSVDYSDWNISMANDPFGYAISGAVQPVSGDDVTEMTAIGWNMTPAGVTAAQAAAKYALV